MSFPSTTPVRRDERATVALLGRWRLGVLGLAFALVASVVSFSAAPSAGALAPAEECNIGSPAEKHLDRASVSPSYAAIWRLYQAYFLRQPEDGGMAFWMEEFRNGRPLRQISAFFAQSDEFIGRYGNVSDAEFTNLVYRNVMCRTPDNGGRAYWIDRLDNEPGFSRGELMLFFSDSPEYKGKTETEGTGGDLTPLSSSTWADDGYILRDIPGGMAVKLDYARVDFSAGTERCSVASINGNWFSPPEAQNPTPTGLAVIDGMLVNNGVARADRGILGERWTETSADVKVVHTSGAEYRLGSSMAMKGGRAFESYSGYHPPHLAPEDVEDPAAWRWAAAGIPMIIDGQRQKDVFDPPNRDAVWEYTYNPPRHSFVAVNKNSDVVLFGSTTGMSAWQLADFVEAEGYTDLIKFDGGGSVEFNVAGVVKVAGTPRDVPLWLGVGCG